MSTKTSIFILLAIVVGIMLGGIFGFYLPNTMLSLSFLGQLFLNALKIVAIPLVVASLIVGVASMNDFSKIRRTVGKTLAYFGITSAIAVIIGLALVMIIQPGINADTQGSFVPAELSRLTSFSISDLLGSVLPNSLIFATAEGRLLGLIIFALFVGAVLAGMGSRGKVVVDFFEALGEALRKLTGLLYYAAPVGLMSLVATAIARDVSSWNRVVGSLSAYSVTLLLGFLIQGLIILPLALKFLGHQSPFTYLGRMFPAIATAFGTASSAATLPVTYDCVVRKNEIDERAAAFTLPLGSMINMNGTALYVVVAGMFIAQMFGVSLSVVQIVTLVLAALGLSIVGSAIPNVSLLILGIALNLANFPVEAYAAIGLLLAVDWFFERWRTAVDVWGDAVGAAVIAETFDFKTARNVQLDQPSRRPFDRPSDRRPPDRHSDRHSDRRPGRDRGDRDRDRDRPRPVSASPDRPLERTESNRRERAPRDNRPERPRRGPRQDGPRGDRRREMSSGSSSEEIQRKKTENKSPFVMPPIPYHVLETELKGKKDADAPRPDYRNEVKPEPAPKAVLNEETIERERAKVAAQLAAMRARETAEKTSEPELPARIDEPTPDVAPNPDDESRAHYPKIDFYSEPDDRKAPAVEHHASPDPEPNPERIPATEPVTISHESDDDDTARGNESSEPVSYGRARARRGAAGKAAAAAEGKSEPEPADTPTGYSTENISFGRSKRKKPQS